MYPNPISAHPSGGIAASLGTLLLTMLSKKYNLSPVTYCAAFSVVTYLINLVISAEWEVLTQYLIISEENMVWISSAMGIISIGVGGYYLAQKLKPTDTSPVINISDTTHILAISRYTERHASYYRGLTFIQRGNVEGQIMKITKSLNDASMRNFCTLLNSLRVPPCDVKYPFVDTEFNQSGYICWRKANNVVKEKLSDDQVNEVIFPIFSIDVSLDRGNITDVTGYIEKMVKSTNDNVFESRHALTILKGPGEGIHNHIKTLVDERILSDGELYHRHIASFFHPERDRIWNWAKTVHHNPEFFYHRGQPAFFGIICEGPPGTGKSVILNKIAAATRRFPLVVDIRTHSKQSVYQILERPFIHGIHTDSGRVVLGLDEFDEVIRYLREKKKFRDKMIDMQLNRMSTSGYDMMEEPTEAEKIKKASNPEDKIPSIGDSLSELTIKDLLTIIQGPIPNDRMMIVATTNNFEYIEKECPQLVRDGRLTRIKFDYPCQKVVEQMSEYYFGKALGITIPKLEGIPTSRLTQICSDIQIETLDKEIGHRMFVDKVKEITKEVKLADEIHNQEGSNDGAETDEE